MISSLPRRSQCEFIEPRTLFARTPRKSFCDRRTDPAQRAVELIGKSNRSAIAKELRHVSPADLRDEKTKPIRQEIPQGVVSDALRNLRNPFIVCHAGLPHVIT